MGLGSNIHDVSSDSVPLLFIAIIANCICYTRSIVFWVFNSFGFDGVFDYDFDEDHYHDVMVVQSSDHSLLNAVGLSNGSTSAAAAASDGLILLNLNHEVYNYKDHHHHHHHHQEEEDDRLQCIVCLCRLRYGDHVRQLGCRHIFHKNCLDGWLIDHFNSTCPLCRSPLVMGSHQLHLHPHQESIISAF